MPAANCLLHNMLLADLMQILSLTGIESRESYYAFVQDGMREIMAAVMGANDKIEKIDLKNLVKIIFEYDFIKSLIMEIEEGQTSQFAMDAQMLFLQMFGANEENFDEVQQLYTDNFVFLNLFAKAFAIRKDIMTQLLFRDNAMGIAIGHMPEVSYSFLSACDTRFLGKDACKMNDGTYQILHIQEPTSFTLVEKNLKREVFSYKEGIMKSGYLSAEKFADGSIDIYLPKNGSYEYVCDSLGLRLGLIDPVMGESDTNIILPMQGEF